MTNFKKYALAAAIVLPTLFTASNKAEASVAVKNESKANVINVREAAGLDSNVIGGINTSKAYEVIENNNGWLKINFDGKEAFVCGDLFDITEKAKVVSPANFRKADNLDSEIYQVLQEGNVVEVKAVANNGFIKVSFEGKEGYVYSNLLDLSQNIINSTLGKVVSNQQAQAPAQSYQASAQTYQAPAQSYQAPAQTQAPAQNYTANNSSAKQIIAQRESGGSYNARNGQYIGKYQLSASYLNGDYSPANQERVADQYVAQRYGSWDNALAFWNNNGWY
ncbi:MAG: SH3 domain-containing protein [Anaerococcus vaginalis]|uniref:aggregation-promoting factor C-terminal-like domain-containing protein n=1 Tax=Anaerococcus vaginalis TaxID=33037 RepID=UPI00290F73B2|nr:SH3 domain-containing protein [Anaerococcus vaginalis]MDU4447895.1 SH3 domain-containing protein [Anaerococcus vaginalis]MDU6182686.1 SH3 domain-containing protein [Anaerococcus vaginalis]MDU7433457.1 SH3 domain-containing protein [Anaerococcus vaginalis]